MLAPGLLPDRNLALLECGCHSLAMLTCKPKPIRQVHHLTLPVTHSFECAIGGPRGNGGNLSRPRVADHNQFVVNSSHPIPYAANTKARSLSQSVVSCLCARFTGH